MAGVPTEEEFFGALYRPASYWSDAGITPYSPDMWTAWKNFGGKTLDEAYALFCESPDSSSEDFMWMPEDAFRFYYPVMDRYLRQVPQADEDDLPDISIWLLSSSIEMHFDGREHMTGLHDPVIALCDYVCSHVSHFELKPDRQHELLKRWECLRNLVEEDKRGIHG